MGFMAAWLLKGLEVDTKAAHWELLGSSYQERLDARTLVMTQEGGPELLTFERGPMVGEGDEIVDLQGLLAP